jgi:hypothetical protein
MGDIVNLNKFRKQKARDSAEKQAKENRILHGRPKALKTADRLNTEKIDQRHSGKKRGCPEDDPSSTHTPPGKN